MEALEIVSPFNQLLIAHYGYLAVYPTQMQVMQVCISSVVLPLPRIITTPSFLHAAI